MDVRVQPPLLERELVDMFMGTLQGPYLNKMVGSDSSSFSDLVVARERIENCLKSGRIQMVVGTSIGAKILTLGKLRRRRGELISLRFPRGNLRHM